MDLPYAADSARREAGLVIQEERFQRGFTAEQAAKIARVAYKTWLRIESGKPVRSMTWNGVDRLFALPPGTARGMRTVDELKAELKRSYEEALQRMGAPTASDEANFAAATATLNTTLPRLAAAHTRTPVGRDLELGGKLSQQSPRLAERLRGLGLEDLRRLRDMVDAAVMIHEEAAVHGPGAVEFGLLSTIVQRVDRLAAAVRAHPEPSYEAAADLEQAKEALSNISRRHPEYQHVGESIAKFEKSSEDSMDDLWSYLTTLREEMKTNGEH